QQEMRRGYTLAQESKKSLSLGIQPVQILEDQDEELVQTLAQQQPLDGLKRALAPDLRVHLLQRRGSIRHPQQSEEIGKDIFQRPVQRQDFTGDLLPPLSFVVLES